MITSNRRTLPTTARGTAAATITSRAPVRVEHHDPRDERERRDGGQTAHPAARCRDLILIPSSGFQDGGAGPDHLYAHDPSAPGPP